MLYIKLLNLKMKVPTCVNTWQTFPLLKQDDTKMWEHIFTNVYKICRETKL